MKYVDADEFLADLQVTQRCFWDEMLIHMRRREPERAQIAKGKHDVVQQIARDLEARVLAVPKVGAA